MEEIISTINSYIWSMPLVILCLAAGLYFSIGTRFVQVRHFREMCRLLFAGGKKSKTGISSFQAFSIALSGRVGTGNIVGVATAIGYGGPGAIVWMWIIAFMGAGSAFAESTLAQVYKEEHNKEFRGGPAYFIEKGLKCRWLGVLFAVCTTIACGICLPPVHSNGISIAFSNAFNIDAMYAGLAVAILIALVIIGGVKRIANVAQIIAPLMAVLYIILSIIVLICNIETVPSAFKDMILSAFGQNEMLGGILGSTVAWGVKRGIYSNEAGQGSGAIVAGAAKVSHPVKQGLVQAFSVYIDTLLVCTATAVMILATKTFNVYDSAGNILYASPIANLGAPDVSYTSAAISTIISPFWAKIIVSVALFFFAFTTVMAYYYYAETNIVYLFG
ncbi:MAG: alanine:cation symporter family protein, partial [Bacteroidales bacterium]|nr:alanine:cation symporter family protein [Bacteroidales bacterium]